MLLKDCSLKGVLPCLTWNEGICLGSFGTPSVPAQLGARAVCCREEYSGRASSTCSTWRRICPRTQLRSRTRTDRVRAPNPQGSNILKVPQGPSDLNSPKVPQRSLRLQDPPRPEGPPQDPKDPKGPEAPEVPNTDPKVPRRAQGSQGPQDPHDPQGPWDSNGPGAPRSPSAPGHRSS